MISDKGLALIKEFEGMHDGNKATPAIEPMLDPVGYPTIGWGSRYDIDGKEVTMQTRPHTIEECTQLLHRDTKNIDDALNEYKLTQNQHDALASFCYNLGIGAFQKSLISANIKAGLPVTEDMFTVYSKAKDQRTGQYVTLQGLLNRRKKEYALFCM